MCVEEIQGLVRETCFWSKNSLTFAKPWLYLELPFLFFGGVTDSFANLINTKKLSPKNTSINLQEMFHIIVLLSWALDSNLQT